MVFGYARVSTKQQNEDRQLAALKEYGVADSCIYIDKESGKNLQREQYQILRNMTQKVIYNVCSVVIFYTENPVESDFSNATIWES